MQYVGLAKFCEMTGLNPAEVESYEARGLISHKTKGAYRFYSLRETYRTKGILFFMRTQGLTAEQAAVKMDETTSSANLHSCKADFPAAAD
jgi:DNA-binding transcriptional MerR regulator